MRAEGGPAELAANDEHTDTREEGAASRPSPAAEERRGESPEAEVLVLEHSEGVGCPALTVREDEGAAG